MSYSAIPVLCDIDTFKETPNIQLYNDTHLSICSPVFATILRARTFDRVQLSDGKKPLW